jgi:hypothetical protein
MFRQRKSSSNCEVPERFQLRILATLLEKQIFDDSFSRTSSGSSVIVAHGEGTFWKGLSFFTWHDFVRSRLGSSERMPFWHKAGKIKARCQLISNRCVNKDKQLVFPDHQLATNGSAQWGEKDIGIAVQARSNDKQ